MTRRYSFTGLTKTSTPGILILSSFSHSFAPMSLPMRPARRSVISPAASIVQKVPADGDVVGTEGEVDPEGFEHAAADLELQRIVSE